MQFPATCVCVFNTEILWMLHSDALVFVRASCFIIGIKDYWIPILYNIYTKISFVFYLAYNIKLFFPKGSYNLCFYVLAFYLTT